MESILLIAETLRSEIGIECVGKNDYEQFILRLAREGGADFNAIAFESGYLRFEEIYRCLLLFNIYNGHAGELRLLLVAAGAPGERFKQESAWLQKKRLTRRPDLDNVYSVELATLSAFEAPPVDHACFSALNLKSTNLQGKLRLWLSPDSSSSGAAAINTILQENACWCDSADPLSPDDIEELFQIRGLPCEALSQAHFLQVASKIISGSLPLFLLHRKADRWIAYKKVLDGWFEVNTAREPGLVSMESSELLRGIEATASAWGLFLLPGHSVRHEDFVRFWLQLTTVCPKGISGACHVIRGDARLREKLRGLCPGNLDLKRCLRVPRRDASVREPTRLLVVGNCGRGLEKAGVVFCSLASWKSVFVEGVKGESFQEIIFAESSGDLASELATLSDSAQDESSLNVSISDGLAFDGSILFADHGLLRREINAAGLRRVKESPAAAALNRSEGHGLGFGTYCFNERLEKTRCAATEGGVEQACLLQWRPKSSSSDAAAAVNNAIQAAACPRHTSRQLTSSEACAIIERTRPAGTPAYETLRLKRASSMRVCMQKLSTANDIAALLFKFNVAEPWAVFLRRDGVFYAMSSEISCRPLAASEIFSLSGRTPRLFKKPVFILVGERGALASYRDIARDRAQKRERAPGKSRAARARVLRRAIAAQTSKRAGPSDRPAVNGESAVLSVPRESPRDQEGAKRWRIYSTCLPESLRSRSVFFARPKDVDLDQLLSPQSLAGRAASLRRERTLCNIDDFLEQAKPHVSTALSSKVRTQCHLARATLYHGLRAASTKLVVDHCNLLKTRILLSNDLEDLVSHEPRLLEALLAANGKLATRDDASRQRRHIFRQIRNPGEPPLPETCELNGQTYSLVFYSTGDECTVFWKSKWWLCKLHDTFKLRKFELSSAELHLYASSTLLPESTRKPSLG